MKNFIKINVIFLTIFAIFSSTSLAADRILPIPKPTVEEEVKKITGYSIGGVSPIGLSKSIKLIIDTSLKRFDKIWSAAGHPHCVFSASFTQLKDITGALETEKLTE